MEQFLDAFKWNWYDPNFSASLGFNYNTGFVIGDDGEPNGDTVTMLEIGLIIGGLTIFLSYNEA